MIRNHQGFSLLELMTVVTIIGVLAHMSFIAYSDMMCRSGDVAAITDARNLMTVSTEKFIVRSYPDFTHGPGDGYQVGLNPDGTYTFTLSTGVGALITGKPSAAGEGYMEGFFFHQKGTTENNPFGRRMFYCLVDEKASVFINPHF